VIFTQPPQALYKAQDQWRRPRKKLCHVYQWVTGFFQFFLKKVLTMPFFCGIFITTSSGHGVRGEPRNEEGIMETVYTGKDQKWPEGETTYWFELSGSDYGTGFEADGDVFGVIEGEIGGDYPKYVDSDGVPLVPGNSDYIAVERHCVVTDDHRL
jgi:hypothetical protein